MYWIQKRDLSILAFLAAIISNGLSCKPANQTQLLATRNLGTTGCTPQQLELRAAESRETASNSFSVDQVAFQSGSTANSSFGLSNIDSPDPCASFLSDASLVNPIRDGLVTVDWKCSGRRRMSNGGLKQDEYCEWERSNRDSGGNLSCTFTTSFDHSRKFFLTSREKLGLWKDTQFNSYAYLAGGKEVRSNVSRRGIINHCLKKPCGAGDMDRPDYFGNCIGSRASDPESCKVVNQAALKSSCKIEVPISPIITAQPSSLRDLSLEGDREIKLFLRPNDLVRKYCKHILDPSFQGANAINPGNEGTLIHCDIPSKEANLRSCDDVADYVEVVASVKLSGCK